MKEFYDNAHAAEWLFENLVTLKKANAHTLEVHLKNKGCLVAQLSDGHVDEMEVRDFATGMRPNFFLSHAIKNLYEARKHTVI